MPRETKAKAEAFDPVTWAKRLPTNRIGKKCLICASPKAAGAVKMVIDAVDRGEVCITVQQLLPMVRDVYRVDASIGILYTHVRVHIRDARK